MAQPLERRESTTPEWQHEGIEATYRELQEAQVIAAKGIQGHLLELGKELDDRSPIRIIYSEGTMDRHDLVFNLEDGSLMREVWETHIFAPEVPIYSRNTYGSNIEIERIKPRMTTSALLSLERHSSKWIESGKQFANEIHGRIERQVAK